MQCMFGNKMPWLIKDEKIKEITKRCYIHIVSIHRILDLFAINSLNLASMVTKDKIK